MQTSYRKVKQYNNIGDVDHGAQALTYRFIIYERSTLILVVHGTHTKKNGSVNVEFKTPSRGGKKSASLKKLKIVKTSNSMHSAWKKVS